MNEPLLRGSKETGYLRNIHPAGTCHTTVAWLRIMRIHTHPAYCLFFYYVFIYCIIISAENHHTNAAWIREHVIVSCARIFITIIYCNYFIYYLPVYCEQLLALAVKPFGESERQRSGRHMPLRELRFSVFENSGVLRSPSPSLFGARWAI